MRIRDRDRITRIRPGRERPARRGGTGRLDARMSYHHAGHTWTFDQGKILLDGYDINPLISEEDPEISTLLGVASGLTDYKKRVSGANNQPPGVPKFLALVNALLDKIMGRVKTIYDDKMYGVKWKLKDNELTINGVNVDSFLKMYRVRKTPKAFRFLKGLQAKVEMLIANPGQSQRNEKAARHLRKLRREIDAELSKYDPTMAGRLLSSGDRGS